MSDWIRESNLIEDIDDPAEDARCWKAWMKLQNARMSIKTILRLHRSIMWVVNRPIAGKYRRCNVRVGGYVAPNWFIVPERMAEWFDQWASANTEETIKLAHIEFEKIHPFEDGNGRVGRMVMNWQLHRAKFPLFYFLASRRQHYYEWFH